MAREKEIGIRELKARASEVVRAVKEQRARYVITQRGKPAALLIPLDADYDRAKADEVWARLEELGRQIAECWTSEKSAVEILSEMRR